MLPSQKHPEKQYGTQSNNKREPGDGGGVVGPGKNLCFRRIIKVCHEVRDRKRTPTHTEQRERRPDMDRETDSFGMQNTHPDKSGLFQHTPYREAAKASGWASLRPFVVI